MQQRRKFSEEFKREAVGLTRQPGCNITQIARDLGSTPTCFGGGVENWMCTARNPFPVRALPATKRWWRSSATWRG